MAAIGFSPTQPMLDEQEFENLAHARDCLTGKTNAAIAKITFAYLFPFPSDRRFGKDEIPRKILRLEQEAFNEASQKVHAVSGESGGYPCQGNIEYPLHHFFSEQSLPATQLIETHLKSIPANIPYLLFDVGAGAGQFAIACKLMATSLRRTLIAHSLSASDLRPSDEQVQDEYYHIGDATKILSNPNISSKRWHCITSRLTFYLFPDQLRCLAEHYELLLPGGLMIIAQIPFTGLAGQLNEFAEFLNEQGYSCILTSKSGADVVMCSCLIIQKTHEHLNLPIIYDSATFLKSMKSAYYSPDPRYLSVSLDRRERSLSQLYGAKDVSPEPMIVLPSPDDPLTKLFKKAFPMYLPK